MKVLLFVQTGDARPTVLARFRAAPAPEGWLETRRGAAARNVAENNFDRWWLVECENADAGRALIAAARMPTWGGSWQRKAIDRASTLGLEPAGRILASGGKR